MKQTTISRCEELLRELAEAAHEYTDLYLQDERDDVQLCVCGEDQHRRLVRLFDAIKDALAGRA